MGWPRRAARAGAGFPLCDGVEFVAEELGHVGEGEAGERAARGGILNLDTHAAGGGGGVVELEFLAGEDEGRCSEFTETGAGVHRRETLAAHGEAADAVIGVAVVFADVERPLGAAVVVEAAGDHVAALGPVFQIGAGACPGFEERAIPGDAVAARHENGVGDAGAAAMAGDFGAVGREAFGEREEEVWRGGADDGG
jgi:hypothetical protein